ncbi:MAG: hypothetical protein Q7Q71_13720 [Verrucomicrobiota bacterium JB023]|nr:hypothetical protein [Verrucomicrobiota bacterium JB023]
MEIFTRLAFGALAVILTGCLEEKKQTAEPSALLFSPRVGEEWVYEVKVTLDRSAQIPEGLLERGPEGIKENYQKTRTYRGIVEPAEGAGELSCFEVRKDGGEPEYEYVILRSDAILAKGGKLGDDAPVILQKPLTLWKTSAKAGDAWGESLPDEAQPDGPPLMSRLFRYLGEEEIEVLGKTMKARHLRMEGNTGPLLLRHDYWFVDRIGYVKERRSYFSSDKRLMVMEEHLVEHNRPAKSPAP